MTQRKSTSGAYIQLRVGLPVVMSKIVRNHLASVDSVHLNIAEGHARKSRTTVMIS